MHRTRKSGILLHPTSLPGKEGIGTLGTEARQFVDFLHLAGQSVWQVLPLGPTAYGNSPYSCYSAFAGNPLLIDLAALVCDGDLASRDVKGSFPADWVDFPQVETHKLPLLERAAGAFFAAADQQRMEEFWHFCDANNWWLQDFALFMALKSRFKGKNWSAWPRDISRRESAALQQYGEELGPQIGAHKYVQWQFYRQWHDLKSYAGAKGVELFGDIPIFVAHDSADVWANPGLFHLDGAGQPTVVAGVPPDYFSKTGQLWGNPLYRWEEMAAGGYDWWTARLRSSFALYDLVRIDHFRGFEAYWEVPAKEKTAVNGRWVKGPGEALFTALETALGKLPIVAEDLGVITPEVEVLRDRFGFAGMKILQFAFGSGPDNAYLPHNHVRNCVVYTGTHDNDTTLGWFDSLKDKDRQKVLRYLDCAASGMPWGLVRAAMASVAALAVIPLQDFLELPASARMNVPGTPRGNWSWRFTGDVLSEPLAKKVHELTEIFGRLNR
ncbi:4-alpha-glucanotransferase [Geobacter sp. AOG1]|uniref:4-alpha-glucanotransferase n=1 Tax=Geobacter sp. AOG1 TaxID=1566346 RepID=UPI001CC4753D|nr:4-alpha-glucanotransferase [Geobacter sp. AOG1]GFE59057.1 4-alpha-glucanotransferase [Geobacter sp. AOG1]